MTRIEAQEQRAAAIKSAMKDFADRPLLSDLGYLVVALCEEVLQLQADISCLREDAVQAVQHLDASKLAIRQ